MSIERWSTDRRYGLRLEAPIVASLQRFCDEAGDLETGGILVGRYSTRQDCATVTMVVGPPRDSSRGKTWFRRGVSGLAALLAARWREHRDAYIGEWHYHPGGPPKASQQDRNQLREIARRASARCPVPVLLIVARSVEGHVELGAWVVPQDGEPLELPDR
jgi:integrative and conjugative element protein (TIGR02256 family)